MITVNEINTASVKPSRRLDCWNESISNIYSGISIESSASNFLSKALHVNIGQLGLARLVSDESKVNRTPLSLGEGHEDDSLKLHFQNGGSSLNRQGSKEAILTAGEVTVCENKTPYSIDTSSGSDIYALSIPLSLASTVLPVLPDQIMKVFNGYSLHGRLLFNMLHTIYNECQTHSPKIDDTAALERVLLELIRPVLSDQTSDSCGGDSHNQLQRLKTLVQENISKTELTTEFIAVEAGLSERRVQALFAAVDITPTIYIRLQRLHRATEYLQFSPELSITQIAYLTGFNDSAYFSRCFRQHFSETPKSYRARYSQTK
jgi:AraC-like DNA-binding protein